MSSKAFAGRHARRQDFADSVQRRKNDPGLDVSDILDRVGRSDTEENNNANS